MANGRVSVRLGWPRGAPRDQGLATQRLAWQEPELPGLLCDFPRRLERGQWSPMGTLVLVRHRTPGGHVRFSHSHAPSRGYALDRVMGFVQRDPQPGTLQITRLDEELFVSDSHGEVPADHVLLGHVHQLPYVLLVPVELRRLRDSGQVVLVGDERDPMWHESDHVATVGWIEGAPIEPLGPVEHTATWGLATLVRRLDRVAQRHVCDILPDMSAPPEGAVCLGGLWSRRFGAQESMVALQLTDDGRLGTTLTTPRGAPPTLAQRARWVAAPVRWEGPRRNARAAMARAVLTTRNNASPSSSGTGEGVAVGWLRREPTSGCSPLFSATHPVVGDQFVTRSAIEATDMGYVVDGVLGYVSDRGADRSPPSEDVGWASRFGRARRYVEGPNTADSA
jgi:hypothetical protein